MLCSAVFVDCLVLNPCCVVMFGMFCVMYGRITFSSVFAITDRRDIGLYDVPMLMYLLGLGIGMILASFHTLSGPVELLFLLFLIAAWTCSVVMFICVGCNLSTFLVIFLFVVLVL